MGVLVKEGSEKSVFFTEPSPEEVTLVQESRAD